MGSIPAKTPVAGQKNSALTERRPAKDRIRSYFHIHGHTLFSSLGRIFQNPQSSSMTVMVIAVALTLPGIFYLFIENVKQLNGLLENQHFLSVYMSTETSNQSARQFAQKVLKKPSVKTVEVITKEAGLREFRAHSGFGDALSMLGFNPLPAVVRIEPDEPFSNVTDLTRLVDEFQRMPEVESVQIDLVWMQRLRSFMHLANKTVFVLSLLLAIAVIFIVGNTIRLELQNRKAEIVVAKLVGATDGFIRRPLIYSGFWYGVLSGILALIFISCVIFVLEQPVSEISLLYHSRFQLRGLDFSEASMLTGISIMLGITGAWLILWHQIDALKPE